MKCANCGKSLWFVRDVCVFCKTKLSAPPRPKSVTVISWLAIVSAAGSAWFLWVAREVMARPMAQRPISANLIYVNVPLIFICGIAMLRGMNWARWTLVVVLGFAQVSKLISGSGHLTPATLGGLVWFGVVAYYLFRPAAKAFFTVGASLALKAPEGQAKCSECGQLFPTDDMIRHGTLHVCAAGKPRFMQKLSEGAEAGGIAKPGI